MLGCSFVLHVPAWARAKPQAGHRQRFDAAAFAALRLPCAARSPGPSHNSLRSLRSLRSNRCDESDDEARQMRARPEDLCSSAAPIRPTQAPPAALPATAAVLGVPHATNVSAMGHPGRDQRACEAPSSAGFGARAHSALRELTRRACSTTVSAANGGSCATGPRARAAQGSRSEAKTASPKRWALPGWPVAAPLRAMRTSNVRNGPQAALCTAAFHPSPVARGAVEQMA